MSLSKRIINLFYKAATSTQSVRNVLTSFGLIFFFSFILLTIVPALYLDRLLRLPKLLPSSVSIIIGMSIITMGMLLSLWSVLHFVKVKGTPVPFNPPPKLVTTGPYAWVRNPMVTGLFVQLLGIGVLIRSISLVFIFTPLFILLNVWELKVIEEPELEKRLGEEYVQYKKSVPMFIPRPKGRASRERTK